MNRSGFRKPENALKRAIELEGVGQSLMAWDVLKEQLNSKKHRSAWSSVHEKLMIKFIDLSVALQKQPDDGLKDFKQITAMTAVSSLGVVVRYFLDTATKRVEAAQALVTESMAVVDTVEDLEETITPEEMLLAAVSDDDNESRTHKALLMPWVKYLWEGYRAVLEVLRNNNKLEDLYQEVAQRAFAFCHTFQRRNEFGRLVDQLRRHFQQCIKYPTQQNAIDLSNPVTLQLLLETRFEQLNTAIKMDLWKVAFASIEDIHQLMDEGPRAPKPLMVAEYYKKLAMIFWKSETYLLHAAALHKLFMITKEHNKKFSGEAAQQMAAQVLLATLAVPVQHPDLDILKVQVHQTTYAAMENSKARIENARKMCMYAGINAIPTREELMQSLVSMNIMQYVPPNLKELFNVMEQEFQPLHLAAKVQPILEFIEGKDHLELYSKALKELVLLRLIKQLSQVYTTITMSRLNKLAPFLTPVQIEKALVDAVTGRTLVFRLNHRDRSIVFSSTLLVASDDTDGGAKLAAPQTGVLRGQLTTLSKRLHKAIHMIDPDRRGRVVEQRQRLSKDLVGSIEQEHDQIVKRKRQIEKLKEEQEQARVTAAKEQRIRAAQAAQEKRRLEELRTERERLAREAREAEEAEKLEKLREKKAIIESIRITESGRQALARHLQEDLEQMPIEAIYKIQEEYNRKQEDQLTQRLQAQERKVDYLERAMRKEEIPLLAKELEDRKAEWLAKSKAEHARRLAAKGRLLRMTEKQKAFAELVLGERQAEYAQLKAEFDKKVEAQRVRKEKERKQREEQLRKEKEEAARREEAAAAARAKAEEERMAAARQKKADEAKRAEELARVAEKQRQREAELEEREAARRQQEQEAARVAAERTRPAPGREPLGAPTRVQPGGWRDRERQREQQRTGGPSARDGPSEGDRWQRDPRGAGPGRDERPGAYRPPIRRGDDGPPRRDFDRDDRGSAYRPPIRRGDDGPPRERGGAYRPPGRDDGGDRWQRGGALPAREPRGGRDAPPARGGDDDGWQQATSRRPPAGRGRPLPPK